MFSNFFIFLIQSIKFKTDQAQDAKKMEKFNNIFFTLTARGPEGTVFTYMCISHYHLLWLSKLRGSFVINFLTVI